MESNFKEEYIKFRSTNNIDSNLAHHFYKYGISKGIKVKNFDDFSFLFERQLMINLEGLFSVFDVYFNLQVLYTKEGKFIKVCI